MNATFSEAKRYRGGFNEFYADLEGAFILIDISGVTLVDCLFLNNGPNTGQINSEGSALALLYSQDVNVTNCEFKDNIGRAIVLFNSTITVMGSTAFSNNTASVGGAMTFYGDSYVILANNSDTLFANNSAEMVGGAIYVDKTFGVWCFFTFQEYIDCNSTHLPFSVTFENNTAKNGGDKVYGASLDICWATSALRCRGFEFVGSIFNVTKHQSDSSEISAITSNPTCVCLCESGRPSCITVFSNITVHPGETFQVPTVVAGDRFGTVDGSVFAQLLPPEDPRVIANLESLQISQRVTHEKCTNLSYTILSNSRRVTLVLTTSSELVENYPDSVTISEIEEGVERYEKSGKIKAILRSLPVYINITLLSCPMGFILSGAPPRCNCDPQLEHNDVHCNLATQTVQRSGTTWVSPSFKNNTYNGVIVSRYCPNTYCKQEAANVSLGEPDTQCAFNHSGIFCGGCQSGLSLALGSAQCLSCSNAYLALLVPFALAGFALVFFIKLLNLTVAEGTLNGLIFYANIVRANQVAWMPETEAKFLKVFIAWLNLDLGIETCFFDGLNAYWKTWLQFVFPLYIWAITISIVIFSHYSSTAARIFGGNSVQVVATLFLLSYSKLIRIIISILQTSALHYPDGTSEIVWSYDGNIRYLSPAHVPLCAVALVVIVFLWLPYTGILTSAQFLQRIQSSTVTNMLVKLKPFLDAYYGPFKDRHRYWVGLLLLVRGVLFISFAVNPASHAEIDLFVVLIAILGLQMYLGYFGRVYKKNYLSFLENSFLLNLGILAGGTLSLSNESQSALAYTSLGIAFLQFIIIAIFHAAMAIKTFCKCWNNANSENDQRNSERTQCIPAENSQEVQRLVITYDGFREPVLKYMESQT